MAKKEEFSGTACPKCSGRFAKNFSTISGNSKYITLQCTACGYNETKCTGVLS